ncbi:NAD(P)/FAD-dependent oxidoreductase [Sediminibacillus massiliensis]|uniref:NAD(P)/FAD-dependent oxidoreductase n=1 Tax=Sediminibacillus massiliensis TaxID=1926277 RepID=UPI001FEA2566|nr:NAD(P)/FAD-dependent oxidoreductase [Sediminibacillus massiliensis]
MKYGLPAYTNKTINTGSDAYMHDCIVIGGGIAGLQAAIQLGRYQRNVLVADSNQGRSNLCRCYHNILGWPDGISGETLRETGRIQAEELGIEFKDVHVQKVNKEPGGFRIITAQDQFKAKSVLFATGVVDRLPNLDKLLPCLGISMYICPDCDGYEVLNKPVIVIGSGDAGANMAIALTYWTDEVILINHEIEEIDDQLLKELSDKQVTIHQSPIHSLEVDGDRLKGVLLSNGLNIKAEHGFAALGGNEVRSELAADLGVELYKNKHILVDQRTKMTNIENVFAAGDVVAHSEQVTIAMGDGMQAAIWIHKKLKQATERSM